MERELIQKIKNLRSEIDLIRKELNRLTVEKENHYKQKNILNDNISVLINKFKDTKNSLNKDNTNLQDLKKNRNGYQEKIRSLILEIKEQNKIKQELQKKYGKDFNPVMMKIFIEKLEQKIETEALTVEKEKSLMKKIKDVKKKLKESSELTNIYNSINKLSNEIKELKDKYNETNNKIKNITKIVDYEELKGIVKDIEKHKKEREEINNKIKNIKDLIISNNVKIKENLIEISKMDLQLKNIREHINNEKRLKRDELIENKIKIVEEKIKRGEKLNKEDLQVYQYTSEDKN